jgi:hypothetical protein
VIVAAAPDVTRAQLVNEDAILAWGRGKDIGVRAPKASPASLASDGAKAFVMVQLGKGAGEMTRAFAFRYDARGNAVWPAAVDLGEAAAPIGTRVPLSLPAAHVVRASLPGGRVVDIGPDGNAKGVAHGPALKPH